MLALAVAVWQTAARVRPLRAIEAERQGTAAQADLADGWTMIAHVHNHPFAFDNPYGDVAGTLIPSLVDETFYRDWAPRGLRSAVIVNGLDAVDLDMADLPD